MDRVLLHVTPKKSRCRACRHCSSRRLRSKGQYQRRLRHLPVLGSDCELIVHTRRWRCLDCHRSFVPDLPGLLPGRRSSEPFRQQVYRQHHHGIPASAMARLSGLSSSTVNRIYAQFTARLAAERQSTLCPTILGIDEHTLHRRQRFATTFCDLKNHRIFEVVPGRSAADLERFLLTLQGREKVKVVCIDLSSSYRHLVRRFFPNAILVADRFHVVRVVQHHFLELARQLASTLKYQRPWLALLRKAPERHSEEEKERLAALFQTHPILQPIHAQMHELRALLNCKHQTKKRCRPLAAKFLRQVRLLKESGFAPMLTLAKTLESWSQEIAAMWRFTKNNGITEGFHRKMKLIQRRAYGFRNFANYRLRVLAQCG